MGINDHATLVVPGGGGGTRGLVLERPRLAAGARSRLPSERIGRLAWQPKRTSNRPWKVGEDLKRFPELDDELRVPSFIVVLLGNPNVELASLAVVAISRIATGAFVERPGNVGCSCSQMAQNASFR
jgi:hypothetical protein